jgi:nucleoside-diphosphate kinase
MIKEQTFIAIKAEGIQRHLIGEIISRFERRGLKLVAMKMMIATAAIVEQHYPDSDDWYIPTGTKTIEGAAKRGIIMTETPKEVATVIRENLIDHFLDRPIVCMVWEGAHAVQIGRKTVGATNPLDAAPGTIRGDLTVDSYELADKNNRVVRTIVHASGEVDEAKKEIALWFKPEELIDYDMISAEIMYGSDWGRVNKKSK